jgi:hypothetical protein
MRGNRSLPKANTRIKDSKEIFKRINRIATRTTNCNDVRGMTNSELAEEVKPKPGNKHQVRADDL